MAYDRLPGLYREMTIFAMPCRSRWFGLEVEGLGVVFLEAAASGLPVIGGDSGGAPETVVPGTTGFVVDGDESLAEAIRLLLDDPALAAEMGRQGPGTGGVGMRRGERWRAAFMDGSAAALSRRRSRRTVRRFVLDMPRSQP